MPLYNALIESAHRLVQHVVSFEELKNQLSKLVSPEFINGLAEILASSFNTADALGRSYIVDKDKMLSDEKKVLSAKFVVGKYITRANNLNWITAADPNVKISFDLVPLDALAYFREKAFKISGVENQKFLDEIKLRLNDALYEGLSYQQFADEFNKLFISYGIVPENPIRLQTIFRTNLFTSYTAGQLKQVEQVKNQFPIWRCVGVKDNRSNIDHESITNKYFRNGPYPPIWFGCRHTAQFIHIYQSENIPDSEIYDSVYDLVAKDKVIDFLGTGKLLGGESFNQWVSDNPVSNDIQTLINQGLS